MRLTGSRFEDVVADDVDAIIFDLEILSVRDRAVLRRANGRTKRSRQARGLACAFLKRGADDRGQIADVLGDEEVMFHEPLDVGSGRRESNSRAGRKIRRCTIETQPLFRPAGEEMQMAAYAPEELLAPHERAHIRSA